MGVTGGHQRRVDRFEQLLLLLHQTLSISHGKDGCGAAGVTMALKGAVIRNATVLPVISARHVTAYPQSLL
jgi:hypothetical protein